MRCGWDPIGGRCPDDVHRNLVGGRRRSIRLEGREEERDAVECQDHRTWAFHNQREAYCEFFLLAFRGKQPTDFSSVELISDWISIPVR